MSNPFKYGGIVLGDDFCNRKQEQHDIINAVNSGEKLFIYSERRYGKTSLIKQVISTLPKKNYITIYVDIWPIDNDFDFIKNLAKRISESISDTPDKLLNTAKKFFSSLVPSITIDAEGKPAITFGVKEIEDSIPELEKLLLGRY